MNKITFSYEDLPNLVVLDEASELIIFIFPSKLRV